VRSAYKLTGQGEQVVDFAVRPSLGARHHVAWVQDSAASSGKLYLDGALVAENNSFTYTPAAIGDTVNDNLRRVGVTDDRIFFVGNTMIDTLLKQLPRLRQPACWTSLALTPQQYCVVTLHRPANVDGEQQLLGLLQAIADGTQGLPIVFPVHPRTAKNLREAGKTLPSMHYVDPLGYLEFNYLVKHARGVITDSGGITEETTVLGVPCLTLRDNTERPETVTIGTNELIGTDPRKLPPALTRLMAGQWKSGGIPPLWDGKAAERIVGHLSRLLEGG